MGRFNKRLKGENFEPAHALSCAKKKTGSITLEKIYKYSCDINIFINYIKKTGSIILEKIYKHKKDNNFDTY